MSHLPSLRELEDGDGISTAAENRQPDVLIHTFADDHRLSLGKGERFEFLIRTTTVQKE